MNLQLVESLFEYCIELKKAKKFCQITNTVNKKIRSSLRAAVGLQNFTLIDFYKQLSICIVPKNNFSIIFHLNRAEKEDDVSSSEEHLQSG
jgi:hypothetical protein